MSKVFDLKFTKRKHITPTFSLGKQKFSKRKIVLLWICLYHTSMHAFNDKNWSQHAQNILATHTTFGIVGKIYRRLQGLNLRTQSV